MFAKPKIIIRMRRKSLRGTIGSANHWRNEKQTVIFENKYNVNINDFSTTDEIDAVVEKEIGRKLKVVKIENPGI